MEDKNIVIIGIIISIIFVIIGCLWLSISTETLDKIAEELEAKEFSIWNPPLPDYELPEFEGNLIINILIGISFTFITFLISFELGKFLRKKDQRHSK
jgi:amino acid transporter